jgi:hypothetical protein
MLPYVAINCSCNNINIFFQKKSTTTSPVGSWKQATFSEVMKKFAMPPLAAGVWPPDNLQYQTNILLPQTKSSHVKVALLLVLTWSCFIHWKYCGKEISCLQALCVFSWAHSLATGQKPPWKKCWPLSHAFTMALDLDAFGTASLCSDLLWPLASWQTQTKQIWKKGAWASECEWRTFHFREPSPGLGGIWRATIRIGCVILFRSRFHQPQSGTVSGGTLAVQSLHVVAFQRENKRCTMVHQVLTAQTAASDLYKMN